MCTGGESNNTYGFVLFAIVIMINVMTILALMGLMAVIDVDKDHTCYD